MKKRTQRQIYRDFERILLKKSKEVQERNRQEVYERHWQLERDTQKEAHDFYRNYS